MNCSERGRNLTSSLKCNHYIVLGSFPQILVINLFTDTAAILNLLDLKSIMGCPGGFCSVLMCTFWAKRELNCIFLGKKVIIITSKHGTMTYFSHYNLFAGKLKEKLARKLCINTERVYRIVLTCPGHPLILLKSN